MPLSKSIGFARSSAQKCVDGNPGVGVARLGLLCVLLSVLSGRVIHSMASTFDSCSSSNVYTKKGAVVLVLAHHVVITARGRLTTSVPPADRPVEMLIFQSLAAGLTNGIARWNLRGSHTGT